MVKGVRFFLEFLFRKILIIFSRNIYVHDGGSGGGDGRRTCRRWCWEWGGRCCGRRWWWWRRCMPAPRCCRTWRASTSAAATEDGGRSPDSRRRCSICTLLLAFLLQGRCWARTRPDILLLVVFVLGEFGDRVVAGMVEEVSLDDRQLLRPHRSLQNNFFMEPTPSPSPSPSPPPPPPFPFRT